MDRKQALELTDEITELGFGIDLTPTKAEELENGAGIEWELHVYLYGATSSELQKVLEILEHRELDAWLNGDGLHVSDP